MTEVRTSIPPRLDREFLGPISLPGLDWHQCGHFATTDNLEVARAALKELEDAGFVLRSSKDHDGLYYSFRLVHPDGGVVTEYGQYEIVTLGYIARSYSTRPRWEIVCHDEATDRFVRFGNRTYVGEQQVDGYAQVSAEEAHKNARVQPTLYF